LKLVLFIIFLSFGTIHSQSSSIIPVGLGNKWIYHGYFYSNEGPHTEEYTYTQIKTVIGDTTLVNLNYNLIEVVSIYDTLTTSDIEFWREDSGKFYINHEVRFDTSIVEDTTWQGIDPLINKFVYTGNESWWGYTYFTQDWGVYFDIGMLIWVADTITAKGLGTVFFNYDSYGLGSTEIRRRILEGAYLDSIPYGKPAPPLNLSITPDTNSVILKWNKNEEHDVWLYRIYAGIGPDSLILLDSTTAITDTSKIIASLNGGTTYYFRVTAVDSQLNESGFSIRVKTTTLGIPTQLKLPRDKRVEIPEKYYLQQNYPNPFNSETVISYQLLKAGKVELVIFNLLGQKVRMLVSERKYAGAHRVSWDGREDTGQPVSSGVYIYRLKAWNQFVQSRKMLLMR